MNLTANGLTEQREDEIIKAVSAKYEAHRKKHKTFVDMRRAVTLEVVSELCISGQDELLFVGGCAFTGMQAVAAHAAASLKQKPKKWKGIR